MRRYRGRVSMSFRRGIEDALSSLPADSPAAIATSRSCRRDEPPGRADPMLGHSYRGVHCSERASETYIGGFPTRSDLRRPDHARAAETADRLRARSGTSCSIRDRASNFGIKPNELFDRARIATDVGLLCSRPET